MAAPGGNGFGRDANLSSEPLRRFYIDDICALKSNRSMVGSVDRTFYDVESHGSLADYTLIVASVPVPEDIQSQFMISGVPPKGFVFVTWNERNEGFSLVSEDDIELIGRNLDIGSLVKCDQNGTMCGTVISVSPKYTLKPITYRVVDPRSGERGPVRFTRKRSNGLDGTGFQRGDTTGPTLLTNVDPDDLKYSPEYAKGDYILHRQKLGLIRAVTRDVVVMLCNQTVVVVRDPSLIRMPLNVNPSNILDVRSDPSVAPWERNQYISNHRPVAGHLVQTPQINLASGRWIHGQYSINHLEGNILAAPLTEVHVDWICSNVFSAGQSVTGNGPDDGILTPSDLQQHTKVYDRFKVPRGAFEENSGHARSSILAGDYVCFRDAAGAAVKYPQFDHIPPSETFGYDTNVFSVLDATFEVVVRWQDLSITTEPSTSLHRLSGFEEEIMPGTIVALKEQTHVIPNTYIDASAFLNAHLPPTMDDSILRLGKVGVVQAVNSRERVALVRWFKEPNVELLHGGHVLRPSSVFGELEEESSMISVYEISGHPGLDRQISDMVLLAPAKVHQSILFSQPTHDLSAFVGPCTLSYLGLLSFWQINYFLNDIRKVWTQTAWFQRSIEIDRTIIPHVFLNSDTMAAYDICQPLDWIGHIVGLNLDGTITVRLGALEQCRDVRVPFEGILQVLDEGMEEVDHDEVPHEILRELYTEVDDFEEMEEMEEPGEPGELGLGDTWMLDMGVEEAFARFSSLILSQEEEEWSTDHDEDEIESLVSNDDFGPSHDIVTEHALDRPVIPASEVTNEPLPTDAVSDPTPNRVIGKPLSFAIMDTPPPADHHFFHSRMANEGNNSLSLRRLAKEYNILASSLPPGIFARTWESSMNLLRVIIIGPEGTPYEYAPFIIDFYFDSKFPHQPPLAFFHSWTNGMGRINPNLYEDGKICLSILGTWPSVNPDETWSSTNSTLLQILVSVMGLVLVKDPFYNEAGFDKLASEGDRRIESSQYTEKAFVMTRAFIKHALEKPMGDFGDIIAWHYLPGPEADDRPNLLQRAIAEARRMIDHHNAQSDQKEESDGAPASPFVARLSLGAVVMLRRHLDGLENIYKQSEIEDDMDPMEL